MYDYAGTLKQGGKQYQVSIQGDGHPYLPALGDILSYTEVMSKMNLGVIDIPLERIAGTGTEGRTSAFVDNFMPLLSEESEFRAKWAYLYDHQIEKDIHGPIITYEFMNQFHVQEGNKRVSVLKCLDAFSASGQVTRLIPRRSDDKDTKLYCEFLDFYQVPFSCDAWFSKEGSYARPLEAMGKEPNQVWNDEKREYFKTAYDRFSKVSSANGDSAMNLTCSGAFLVCVEIFGYEQVKEQIESEIQKDLMKIKDEIFLAADGSKIALVEKPEEVDDGPARRKSWLLSSMNQEPKDMKIIFIHVRAAEISSWTYGHELGRNYLEQAFGENIQTLMSDKADTEEETAADIDLAIAAGCDIIFITASPMINPSLKATAQHPGVKILNCSVSMSCSSVCTHHGRMCESKFLMGAIAASMTQSSKLGYIADYPVLGTITNINAFALGARMINLYTRVYLEWSRLKNVRSQEALQKGGISYISGEDMITPGTAPKEYDFYHREEGGTCVNLATSILHWGKFYERITKIISHGSSELKGMKGKQAANCWWGMLADVIDVICSQSLPHGANRLISFLRSSIRAGSFQLFDRLIYSQGGVVQYRGDESLSPQKTITMNWLAENIVERVPDFDELTPKARPLVCPQGVKFDDNKDAEDEQIEDTGSGGQ